MIKEVGLVHILAISIRNIMSKNKKGEFTE